MHACKQTVRMLYVFMCPVVLDRFLKSLKIFLKDKIHSRKHGFRDSNTLKVYLIDNYKCNHFEMIANEIIPCTFWLFPFYMSNALLDVYRHEGKSDLASLMMSCILSRGFLLHSLLVLLDVFLHLLLILSSPLLLPGCWSATLSPPLPLAAAHLAGETFPPWP